MNVNEQLKKDIEAVVAEIFSQKEEADRKIRTEEALQKAAQTIDELTTTLESRNAQDEETAAKIAGFESKVKDLETQLEAAKKEIETSNTKLAESEKVVEEMKKDRAAEIRMADLASVGVALSDKSAQTVKVREMTDEVFASYKEELVSLRKSVEAELAKNAEAEEKEEVVEDKEVSTITEEKKEDEVTPPPQIDPKKAASAALNLEVKNTDDILSKYAELGAALAKRITEKKK
jgi:chromosome segregation ATPase